MKENQTNKRITAVVHDRPSVSLAEIRCFADAGCHFSFFSDQVRQLSTVNFIVQATAHSTLKKAPRAFPKTRGALLVRLIIKRHSQAKLMELSR